MINIQPYRVPALSARRRGNVLVLVVVVLGLLALLGGAYLQTARVQRQMFFDTEDCAPLARMFVIEDIKEALKADIFNPETGAFLDVTEGTEPYDRAWTNSAATYDVLDVSGNVIDQALGNEEDDTWLASALPFRDGATWRWRQITTLNGAWFDTDGAADVNDRRIANAAASGGNPADWYGRGGSLRNDLDYNIDAFNDNSLVDADADGLPDARLERIASFPIKNGIEYFAAVRIIDLASFVNLNTALSSVDTSGNFDVSTGGGDAPRGNNPSELNLGNVVRGLTSNPGAFLTETLNFINWRGAGGTDFSDDRERFWERVGRRLGNPANNTNVLGDADEAQLRHRGGAYNLDSISDDVTDATDGIDDVLEQGTGTGFFGTDGINTPGEANDFFPYAANNATGTRIRFTASSGEAIYGVPTPREMADFPNQRVLRTALNNDAYGLSFDYPPADPGVTPMDLQSTLGNDQAFDNGQDSETTPVARPGQRIQDNAEALTELASDVKTIFNNAFSTTKAVASAEPQAGVGTLAPGSIGNNEAPVLFGDVVANDEQDVEIFATQFAANFEDYVDADNILTVLDVRGLPTADRDPDDTRLFPLDNTWTDTANLSGSLSNDTNPDLIRFGFELLPYITEVYVQTDYEIPTSGVVGPVMPDEGGVAPDWTVEWQSDVTTTPAGVGYAIEIRNPFNTTISLNNVHLYVDRTPTAAGSLLPESAEWTTTTMGVTAPRADADFDGDDLPGAGGATDYDLADLVTNQLRMSGGLSDVQSKTELAPNEVLILYRNANAGADDNDMIVNPGKFGNPAATVGSTFDASGVREGSERQWDAGVAAGSIPTDAVIDDRDANQIYTYVELPIDWPITAAATGTADYDPDQVTVELRIAVANEPGGFSTNVDGGNDGSTTTSVPRLDRVRYQVVDSSIAPVDSFTSTHVDLLSSPADGTQVTMQHSTVGNANGVNAMLMRRGDFQNRELFPDQFDIALTGTAVNNGLRELIAPDPNAAPPVSAVTPVTRVAVHDITQVSQTRLGDDEKTGQAGYTPSTAGGSNADMPAVADDQVVMRNGPIELEAEIAHLFLLGIEPIDASSPLESGSTADSFFDSTLRPDTRPTPTSLNQYRLNFGFIPTLALPAGNDELNDDNVHWAKPHARFLLERLTVLSPARDGMDNDGDGSTDEDDEQFLAGRLNVNQAETELIEASLPFGNPTVRGDFANTLEALRGDTNTTMEPALGVAHAWDLIDEASTPTLRTGGDDQTDGVSRIDFLQNDLANGNEDDVENDAEEFFLLTGNAQQVLTTRSDVYVAYILVQGYRDANSNGDFTDGPEDGLIEQTRSIVLFDRSGMVNSSDEVESRLLFEFTE